MQASKQAPIEESKRTPQKAANTLRIESAAPEQKKPFLPYADLDLARQSAPRALSPKLIPYKKHSFSSSDRSSDLARNQEAS